MKPKVIRRRKGTPKRESIVDQPIEKKAEKPIKPKLFATEVKSKKKVQQEPRAKLNADSLLSELSQLNQDDFDKLLRTPQRITVGEEQKGTVIRIQKELYIVDIGAKSEAFLPKDLAAKEHSINDKIDAFVISISSNGIQLSQKTQESLLQKLNQAKEEQTPIEATVVGTNNGGFILSSANMRGFCPKSQIDIHTHPPEQYLQKTYKFIITDVQKNEFVASRRKLLEQEQNESKKEILASLSQGQKSEGVITSITEFGAFVSVFEIEGLLPKRKIPVEKELSIGDKVSVKIDQIDLNKQKIALSLDQKDPWLELGSRYRLYEEYEGKVVQTIDHGVLVSLQFELVGLIHTSKIPPGKTFSQGEAVQVFISSYDLTKRKLRLQLDPPVIVPQGHQSAGQNLSDMFRDLFADKD